MIYKLFSDTVKILIILNKKNRQLYGAKNFSFEDYALEYCTVKCDIGRLTGKSDYIKKHADDKSLVIVMNDKMKQHFLIKNRKFALCSPSDLLNNSHSHQKYETIYIDEPTYVFKNISISKLYHLLSKSYDQTYIWLGM